MTRFRWWLCWLALALLLPAILAGCASTPAATPTETGEAAQATGATPTTPPPTATEAAPMTATPPPAETPTAARAETPTAAPAETSTAAPAPVQARPGEGLPLPAVFGEHFAGSGTCSLCHSRLADRSGEDVSIDTHWRSTMMANGAKDPLWQAKLRSEVLRTPGLEEVIESKCATCHTPMAWTEANATGVSNVLSGEGLLDPANDLHALAMDGISCTLCHQIADQGLGEDESYSGGYAIDTTTRAPDRWIYGPFPDPVQQQMRMHTGYTPVEGQHVRQASLCATCHTLYTPYVDADGNVAGTFPEQVVYLEWAQSAYGAGIPCQGCHMPAAKGAIAISTMPGRLQPREPFSQHHFVGGNAFMTQVLGDNVDDLGLTASQAELEATRARTLAQLENRSARVEVVQAKVDGGRLEVVLAVSNMAGHKFPTGFPSRRAWIHLTVTDAAGAIAFESGRPGADGRIAGAAGDADAALYEPHYDLITDEAEVQIYESVMQDTDGAVTHTLLRGAAYVKDNRLLPAGFDKDAADADTAPRGAAATDETFAGGSDRVTYQIDVGQHAGPYLVTAELLYQSVSYAFAADLWADDAPEVARMQGYYESADHTPVVAWRAERRVSE